jgi:hypothetical protein
MTAQDSAASSSTANNTCAKPVLFDESFKGAIKDGLKSGARVAAFITPILGVITLLGIVSAACSPKN